MKKIALFILSFIVIGHVNAQHKDYDIGSYKTGDYKRKALDFDFGASGFFKNHMEDGKDQSFNSKLSLTYRQTKNSRKLYENTYLTLAGTIDYRNTDYTEYSSNNSNINNLYKTNRYDYSIRFGRTGYHYLNEKNLFFEFSPWAHLSQSEQIWRREEIRQNSKSMYAYALSNIGIGKGKLEQVEDARQAVYILDDLKNKGVLIRELTTDEINEMATIMTQIKNKRQFDSRIRLIQEIETIDSLLVAKGYLDKTNTTAYYTSLYDNWIYGNTPERLSGHRFSVGITPEYSFNRDKYDYKNEPPYDIYNDSQKRINTLFKGSLYVKYTYEKPVKQKFQNSFSTSLVTSLGKYRLDEHNFYQNSLYLHYGWGYYPNTRTYAGIGLNQSLDEARFSEDYKTFNSDTFLNMNAYYYLSPQLRLFGSCNISYRYTKYDKIDKSYNDKHPRTEFGLGMTYSLF